MPTFTKIPIGFAFKISRFRSDRLIKTYFFAFIRKFFNQLVFIRIILILFFSIGGFKTKSVERFPRTYKLVHLFFNFRKILFAYFYIAKIDIVIKSILDSGTYCQFCIRPKLYNGSSQKMTSRMSEMF